MKDYNKEPNYIHSCDSKMLDEVYRQVFMLGYEQAEKDLALTWKDAQLLYIITEKYMREIDNRIEKAPSSSQEVFEEIIRRYKDGKK